MSINRVNITGNLTRDPELRATAGGTQVLSFGVAVNDRRRNAQTGEWEDYPNFVDCTMFGTRAEASEPVSGHRPPSTNLLVLVPEVLAELLDELDELDEPQPASAMTAAATMAVAVMDSFLMPFMLIFFI